MSYDLLQYRWRARGFRRDDLPLALHRLERSAALRIESGPQAVIEVTLLAPGWRQLQGPRWTLAALRPHLRGLWQILAAGWRPAPTGEVALRRRAPDRIDPFPARSEGPPDPERPWVLPQPYPGERRSGAPRREGAPPFHPDARNRRRP